MEYAPKLFEKYNRNVNRTTQSQAWNDVITKLSDSDIFVSDQSYLRKRITNWLQRATVLVFKLCFILIDFAVRNDYFQAASDKLKATGQGKQKPLTEFQLLCLQFLRLAKVIFVYYIVCFCSLLL